MLLDDDDENIMGTDATLLISYLRQIFGTYSELKSEAEKELYEKKETEGTDYEPMLQKLEAEVRQHIRVYNINIELRFIIISKIEQQLKLYVESTQSKADDVEKQNEQFKKDYGVNGELENCY